MKTKYILIILVTYLSCYSSFCQDIYRVKSISPLYKDPLLKVFKYDKYISDTTYFDSTDLKIYFRYLDTIIVSKIGTNWIGDTIVFKTKTEFNSEDIEIRKIGFSKLCNCSVLVKLYKESNFLYNKLEIIYSIGSEFYFGFRYNLNKLKNE
jgi:hypothetical protein